MIPRMRIKSWVQRCGVSSQALYRHGHVPVRRILRGEHGKLVTPNARNIEQWMRTWFARQGFREIILLSADGSHARDCTLAFLDHLATTETVIAKWSAVYLPSLSSCMFAFSNPRDAVTARLFIA